MSLRQGGGAGGFIPLLAGKKRPAVFVASGACHPGYECGNGILPFDREIRQDDVSTNTRQDDVSTITRQDDVSTIVSAITKF